MLYKHIPLRILRDWVTGLAIVPPTSQGGRPAIAEFLKLEIKNCYNDEGL
jgi:hypothetical protein